MTTDHLAIISHAQGYLARNLATEIMYDLDVSKPGMGHRERRSTGVIL